VEQKSQRFLPVSDPGELISSLAVSPDRHVFAVAQKSQGEPSIHVYDLHTSRKRRKLTSNLLKHGAVVRIDVGIRYNGVFR
jgi:Tol biopolymer transport system component